MQYTSIVLFGLVAAAMAYPAEDAADKGGKGGKGGHHGGGGKGGKGHKLKKHSKSDIARCVGALGSAGSQCGGDVASQVQNGAANGAEISDCVFGIIQNIPDCKPLLS